MFDDDDLVSYTALHPVMALAEVTRLVQLRAANGFQPPSTADP